MLPVAQAANDTQSPSTTNGMTANANRSTDSTNTVLLTVGLSIIVACLFYLVAKLIIDECGSTPDEPIDGFESALSDDEVDENRSQMNRV